MKVFFFFTLIIESIAVAQTKGGGLKLTGQLGEVMSESANIAFSYIQSLLADNDKIKEFFNKNNIHISE